MVWISDRTQDVDVASYNGLSREFNGCYTYRAVEGCGLPPMTCFDIPDEKEGFAAVRNNDDSGWDYIADHRGEIAYKKDDGAAVIVTNLGDYPDTLTTLKPATKYDKWDGKKWVTDKAAQKADQIAEAESHKNTLIYEVAAEISILADAVDLGMATPEEEARYTALRRYRVELNRVDTSTAPNITWPVKP